jgi:hypothetical protein
MASYYRHCSICKKPIAFGAAYYQCSVSTCNQKRTALYFCSVPCWDAHVPEARHRDAWAEHVTAPTEESEVLRVKTPAGPERRVVGPRPPQETPEAPDDSDEILVVVSKLKKYISDAAEMNTSSQGMTVLSSHLRKLCNEAITVARREGRKTVLERDFEEVVRKWSART